MTGASAVPNFNHEFGERSIPELFRKTRLEFKEI
jgi:hypothetical protein